jgi:hypothetical protein
MTGGESPEKQAPDTRALLALAEEALTPCDNLDTATERIVAYTEAFDRWYSLAKPYFDVGDEEPLGGLELLKKLEARHGEVIALAEAAMDRTEADAKGLRRKGKGMVAYTDNLPKRISTKRFRPG